MLEHEKALGSQLAQKLLAFEVTELIHGQDLSVKAEAQSRVLYEKGMQSMSEEEILSAFEGESILYKTDRALLRDITEVGIASSLVLSKSAMNKMMKAGGIYVNGNKWRAGDTLIDPAILVHHKFLLLRSGKSTNRVVYFQ